MCGTSSRIHSKFLLEKARVYRQRPWSSAALHKQFCDLDNASSSGCGDHGPRENTECIKDSSGNCVET